MDYLVQKRVPFRQTHRLVGGIVRYGLGQHKLLKDFSLAEFKRFTPKFQNDVYRVPDIRQSINAHNQPGGTSEKMVRLQIKIARQCIKKEKV